MTTNVYIIGVGGQGVLLASKVLGDAAVAAGFDVTISEVHGMAQRGGVVTCDVRIGGPGELGPWSPLIADGDAHVLLAFEPAEAVRGIGKASSSGWAVVNTARVVPFTVGAYGQPYPAWADIEREVRERVAHLVTLDALAIARKVGNERVLNAAMLGALSATGLLPVEPAAVRASLGSNVPAKHMDTNMAAFEAGFGAVGEVER